MTYLLDTCVISELIRPAPSPRVTHWIAQSTETELYLSVLTIGELKKGIDKLSPSRRQNELDAWLQKDLLTRFRGRILLLDLAVTLAWGALAARLEAVGRKMPALDALIAATVLSGGFTLVTRNVADFAQSGVAIVNPWE